MTILNILHYPDSRLRTKAEDVTEFGPALEQFGADLLESWDRGFREDGSQAWGARKGPYLFRRVSAVSEP